MSEDRQITEVLKRQRDFYDKKYTQWPQLRSINLFWKHLGDQIIRLLAVERGKTYLYLGVGDGFLMEHIAKKTEAHITGIDVSSYSIFSSNKKRGNTTSYLCADAQNLPFADNSFNGVIAPAVLHHLPDLKRAFQEFTRVLKDERIVYSLDPKDYFLRRCFNFFLNRIISEDEIQFRQKDLEEAFRSSGFKITSNEPLYLFMPVITPLFRRIKIDIPDWMFHFIVAIDTSLAKKKCLQPLSWVISLVATAQKER
jgi:ubiquinone/menaquinone biosynthesis C-methylase UbiE